MKKHLVLVTYSFKPLIGFDVTTKNRIVSVMADARISETEAQQRACEAVASDFKRSFSDHELLSIQATAPLIVRLGQPVPVPVKLEKISAESLRSLRLNLKDNGCSAEMPLHRIQQLVLETAPYTDRLVLNGLADLDVIKHFQDAGCYCDIMKDSTEGSNYTVIKWSK